MRAGLLLCTWLVLVRAAAARARADFVFRVPEVLVQVRTAAAAVSRAVGTGPTTTRGNLSAHYYVEHEVTAAEARRAAQLLKLSDVSESLPGCGACHGWEREYCLGDAVVRDHCCCERRFLPEPLPWLPHACLLGAARCRPRAASCAHYARLRDCCCLRDLAHKWKSILAGAAGLRGGGATLRLAVMLALRAAL